MSKILCYILSAVIGYLIGSISLSIVLSSLLFHRDVRSQGSGNAGAANTARIFGMGAGALTFLGDFAKTLLALWLGRLLGGAWGMTIAGMTALVGHCYPVYFHFKGGKGVSSGAAIALMIDWRVFAASLAVFGLAALVGKRASVASLCAALAVAVFSLVFRAPLPYLLLGLFTSVFVVVMHRSNIKRLLRGEEPPFRAGHRPDRKR
jgi:glycerol-3-phosphate acyltransferase PlsY